MKPTSKCTTQFTLRSLLIVLFLSTIALLIAGCGDAAQATPTAQIVTVPVEVTRVVEVVNTVEVTRQVLATVIVEIPVTPEATPIVASATNQPAATLRYVPSPTLAYAFESPKAEGTSRLKINNETEDTLTVKVSSSRYYTQLELSRGRSAFLNVPYGDYTITVYRGTEKLYSTSFSCASPLKYEVNLGNKNAKVIPP